MPVRPLVELLDGRSPDAVFTPAERRRCAMAATRPAGLVAAKRAVLLVLDAPPDTWWRDVEIRPGLGRCADPSRCTAPHPPAVHLTGALAERLAPGESVTVSISSAHTVAVALAARVTSP